MFPGCQVQDSSAVSAASRASRRSCHPAAPPPAPTRAVVLRVEGCAAASKPIVLDRAAAYVLDASNGSNGSADGSSDARLVAEVRQVVDAQGGSRELSGTVRSELLLRSDLAFQNATLTPVELRFDRRLSERFVLARARRGRGPTSLAADAVGRRIGARAVAPAPRARRSAILRRRDESRRHSTGRRREGFASGFAGRFGVRLERPGVAEDARGCCGGGD